MFMNGTLSSNDNLPLHIRRIRIQPREDEGRETLPAYSTAISLKNTLLRKMEFDSAIQRASRRNWHRVVISLQGTALNIYRPPKMHFRTTFGGQSESLSLIRRYNLHHAQVGVAVDYDKKIHVIRVRAETEQFLLSCTKIEILVNWMQSLSAAIDLATPLDDRDYPKDFCLPRRQRRNRSSPNLISDQDDETNNVRAALSSNLATGSQSRPQSTRTCSNSRASHRSRSSSNLRSHTELYPRLDSDEDRASLNFSICSAHIPSSTILPLSQSGIPVNTEQRCKWKPRHDCSPFHDMLYAKSCFAILTLYTPRKSNTVIVNGELCIVNWVTGHIRKFNDVVPCPRQSQGISTTNNLGSKEPIERLPEYWDLKQPNAD